MKSLITEDYVHPTRVRWASYVCQAQLAEVIQEGREMHLLAEESTKVADILAAFDEKAEGLDDKMAEIIGDVVNLLVEKAKDIRPELFEDLDVDNPEEAAQELAEKLTVLSRKLKSAYGTYKSKSESEGKRKAAGLAFSEGDGAEAIEMIKSLKDDDMVQAVAKAAGGEFLKDIMTKAVKAVPFVGNVVKGYEMLKGAASLGGKIKSIIDKFRKSKAPPEEKFADFAAKVARGKDQDLGEFAKILQLDDGAEEVMDDRLEVRYVKDYVDKLRTVSPETPVSEIDINDLLTAWIKDAGEETQSVDMEVG